MKGTRTRQRGGFFNAVATVRGTNQKKIPARIVTHFVTKAVTQVGDENKKGQAFNGLTCGF